MDDRDGDRWHDQRAAAGVLPTHDEIVEVQRLIAVRRYDVLDSPPDAIFERLTAMAARWFNVPVASITIVDGSRIWFKSIHGLAGVTQVARDPGLCASAILGDEPYVVTDAASDPRTQLNGLVTGPPGVRFYAGVPIVTSDGYRLGTMNILDTVPREISPADLETLRDLAALVMTELELRLAAAGVVRADRRLRDEAAHNRSELLALSEALQRALLPARLPVVPGAELASHYQRANPEEVGADLYDFFDCGEGRWAFFLADVAGKGAQAAGLAAMVRCAARCRAVSDANPSVVLQTVNEVVWQHGDEALCSMMFGVLEAAPTTSDSGPTSRTLLIGNAGHPAGHVLRADGGMTVVGVPDVVLGGCVDPEFTTTRVVLVPGETLVLCTDGITEARPGGGDWFGPAGLPGFLGRRAGTGAAHLVADLEALLTGFTPHPQDDIAIMALSIPSGDPTQTGHIH